MAVPETPVHENDLSLSHNPKVRLSGKIFDATAVFHLEISQDFPNA
jgi:hypothetical protein